VEWYGQGEKLSGLHLSKCHFVHYKFHRIDLESNPGFRAKKQATTSLPIGTAFEDKN
jgi:hypothetical protein